MAIYNKKIWGWMMYDWATQPFSTLIITFIFAPYFASVVVSDPVLGQSMWAFTIAVVGFTIAIFSPILGAIADTKGRRKLWIVAFSIMYILGTVFLWWAVPNMDNVIIILLLFSVGMLGMEFSQTFVNAMLPQLGAPKDLGRISGNGWALGYLGGLILLFIMLLFFVEYKYGKTILGIDPILGLDAQNHEGTRATGPLVAVWFMIFMVPFFLWTPDNSKEKAGGIFDALKELKNTIINLPKNINLTFYFLSSMFYRDALMGVYAFGGIYAAGVLGWGIIELGVFGVIANIAGCIFTYLGGFVDRAYGSKRVIVSSIISLIIVCVLVIGTSRESSFGIPLSQASNFPDILFFICGVIIGAMGGILQSASRTMLVSLLVRSDRMTEAFGLYALVGRVTAWMAPTLIGIVTYVTQNQQLAIAPVILLFSIGLWLLYYVKVKN